MWSWSGEEVTQFQINSLKHEKSEHMLFLKILTVLGAAWMTINSFAKFIDQRMKVVHLRSQIVKSGRKQSILLIKSSGGSDVRNMTAWRVLLEMSPGGYNKLKSYNSTKDNLRNQQTHLRDLHIETSEGGQIERSREKGRENGRDVGHGLQDTV